MRDSKDDSDNCEDGSVIADNAVMKRIARCDYNSGFIWKDMTNWHGNMETGDNEWEGGIDLKDQLLQMYLVERKRTHKWHIKLFRMH
jgi:hypothetical protein